MGHRPAPLAVALLVGWVIAGCGARSVLLGGTAGSTATGTGGAPPATDAGGSSPDGGPGCSVDDMSTWVTERFRDDGDYERAAVAAAGEPWVALKVRNGNIVLAQLGVDDQTGIVFQQRIEIPDSPVYPVAMDMDADRFVVMTTTGINWNGDVQIWRIDRHDGSVIHGPVGTPTNPAFVVIAAVGLAGGDVVLAYAVGASNAGIIEIRDDHLQVKASQGAPASSFLAVRPGGGAVDLYADPAAAFHVQGGAITQTPVDPAWQVFGGLDAFLVEVGAQIRLVEGASTWSGPWPHTQISPPAVVRTSGSRAAVLLNTELTAVIGHVTPAGLDWLAIEPTSEAPGTGLGLLPVIDDRRLGQFYVGLEIPSPVQPLRYYGLRCP